MDKIESCLNCEWASCALETLSKNEVLSMESQTYQTHFKKGEIVRKQDAPIDSIIYLRKGYVKEFMAHTNHPDQVIQIIKPRSYIGLQNMCTGNSSTFSYQAITEIEVCYIKRMIFGSLVRGNGNFAREILISLSHE